MIKVETGKKQVKSFGVLFAALCLGVGVYLLYKDNALWQWLLAGAVLFAGTGLFVQPVLRPLYVGWMKFAFILGWVNTRLLLGVFFYLIITPTGFVMRVFGKDLLDRKIDTSAKTYWKKRTPPAFDPKQMEHQF